MGVKSVNADIDPRHAVGVHGSHPMRRSSAAITITSFPSLILQLSPQVRPDERVSLAAASFAKHVFLRGILYWLCVRNMLQPVSMFLSKLWFSPSNLLQDPEFRERCSILFLLIILNALRLSNAADL